MPPPARHPGGAGSGVGTIGISEVGKGSAPIDNSGAACASFDEPPVSLSMDSLKVCRCHDAARWPPNRAGCVVRSVVVDAGTSTT